MRIFNPLGWLSLKFLFFSAHFYADDTQFKTTAFPQMHSANKRSDAVNMLMPFFYVHGRTEHGILTPETWVLNLDCQNVWSVLYIFSKYELTDKSYRFNTFRTYIHNQIYRDGIVLCFHCMDTCKYGQLYPFPAYLIPMMSSPSVYCATLYLTLCGKYKLMCWKEIEILNFQQAETSDSAEWNRGF